MADFTTELINAVRNGYCGMLSNAVNFWAHYVPNIAGLPNPGLEAGRLAMRLFCNREPPSNFQNIPFSGGQCAGVLYDWRTFSTFQRADNGQIVTATSGVWRSGSARLVGKITGGGIRLTNNGTGWQEYCTNDQGTTRTSAGGTSSTQLTILTSTLEVRRSDLLADTCGDPPVQRPPSPPNTYNDYSTTIVYNDNSNNVVNVPVTISYSPVYVGVNGDVNVPITINFAPSLNFSTKGNINVSTGDITFDFSNRNYSPSPTGEPDGGDFEPGSDPPPNPVPDPPGTPTTDPTSDPSTTVRTIRAVIVTSSVVPARLSRVFQGDNPDIVIPRIGNVQFLCRIGSTSCWTDAIGVRAARQIIPCPWEGGAIDVRGTPDQGVEWALTPVYATYEPKVTYG